MLEPEAQRVRRGRAVPDADPDEAQRVDPRHRRGPRRRHYLIGTSWRLASSRRWLRSMRTARAARDRLPWWLVQQVAQVAPLPARDRLFLGVAERDRRSRDAGSGGDVVDRRRRRRAARRARPRCAARARCPATAAPRSSPEAASAAAAPPHRPRDETARRSARPAAGCRRAARAAAAPRARTAEAVVEVGAEAPRVDLGAQVAVGRGDHADVDA